MTRQVYLMVLSQILLLILLSSYQDVYRLGNFRTKYIGPCGDTRYIDGLFMAEILISLTYNSTEKLDESEYRVSQIWRPRRITSRKIVLSYETCSFYETHNHAEGTWYLNSSHLILFKTSRTVSLVREYADEDTNNFVSISEPFRLCCPAKIVSYKRSLRIAYYSSKSKIYDKILLNHPYLRIPGCDTATGLDLIEWLILPHPIRKSRILKQKARIMSTGQYCTKFTCFDEWITKLASADVFIFSLTSQPEWKILRKLFPDQIWIGTSGENWLRSANYRYLRNEHDYWGIQFRSDWRLTADLPATFLSSVYFGSPNIDFFTDYSDVTLLKDKLKSVAVVLSNCGAPSRRDEIIMGLSEYFPVVSYGKCYTTLRPELSKQVINRAYDLSFKQKAVLEKHMFAFAIPNVIEVDWIEEKIFSALHAGAIPIVFSNGTANIEDFLPCKRCSIFVDHFSSLHQLSLHLENVANDEKLFAQYHEWRKNFDIKANPRFETAYKASVDTLPCRISEVLRPGSCPPSCAPAQRKVAHDAVHRHKELQRFW